MATQSIIRNGLVSPVRATLQRPGSTRSILRYPTSPSSPSHTAGFKLSAPPKPFQSLAFEDPRSPKPSTKHPSARSITSYPRSPYPSASLVPPSQYNDIDGDDSLNHRTRSSSLELPKRNRKGLTLGPSFLTPVIPVPSPLGRAVFSPSINEPKKPAPLDLESRLSQAFWEALSFEEAENSADEPMLTALEYPSSAVDDPQITYADAEGALWSPALPKPGTVVNRIRDSLMSPAKRSSIDRIVRRDYTAPSPNDPFAAFPSFATAMMDGAVAYPSRVKCEV